MSRARWRRVSVASVALVLGLGLVLVLGMRMGDQEGLSRSPLVGNPAPPLSGKTLDGSRFHLDSLRGSVVLVNVWASWCQPCRDELPLLLAAQRRWREAGLELATINTRDGTVPARSMLRELGASDMLSVRDPDGELAVAWGASGVPETFLVDARGVVRARHIGPVTRPWLREHITRLVKR